MNGSAYIRPLLQANKELLASIIDFNLNLSQYTDPTHIKDIVPEPVQHAAHATTQGTQRLSAFLLKWFQLEMAFDFTAPQHRIALIDTRWLHPLLMYAGAAVYSPNISRVLEKAKIQKLKNFLGEPIYNFALKRAPFFIRLTPSVPPAEYKDDSFLQTIQDGGCLCFELCLAQAPQAITERLRLKFPTNIKWDFHRKTSDEETTKAFSLLRRILAKELNFNDSSCFS